LRAPPMLRSSSQYHSPSKSLLSASLSGNSMHYKPPSEPNLSLIDYPISNDDFSGNDAALKDQAVSFRVFELELQNAREKAAHSKQKWRQTSPEQTRVTIPQSAPTSAFRRNIGESDSPKGKRKVTFNSELAVRTIERSTRKSKPSTRRRESTEGKKF